MIRRKNKCKKIVAIILAIILVLYVLLLLFARYDLKRTNNDTSIGETFKYSIELIDKTSHLLYTSIKYQLSLLSKTEKLQYDGLYSEYPLVGEIFAIISLGSLDIEIINEMSGSYSDIYIHHYPTSAYPGEDKSIWLLADGNSFYKYFNNKELTIKVINVGSFSYELKDSYETTLEEFVFDFKTKEEVLFITFIYPTNSNAENNIHIQEYFIVD